jgi:nucleotide-binding universal stress UspA family protein
MDLITHIMVPTDFSDAAGHALDYAIELSKKHEARLTLLHIYEIPAMVFAEQASLSSDVLKALEDGARQQLGDLMKKVHERVPAAQSILMLGAAGEMIASQAERAGADLIVMGTHGRRGLSHVILGSVAERTLRRASVPVLVLHATVAKKTA